MANIKSQIKRNRQNEKRRLRNRNFRGAARTAVNQARTAIQNNTPDTKEAVLRAISLLDTAAERGVIHPNNAARRKSRLMKRLAASSTSDSGKTPEVKAKPAEAAPKAKKAATKKAPAAKKKATTE